MSKPVNPMAIGSFLIAGLALLIAALLAFGGGQLFKPKLRWVVFFDSSLNGLNVGAPVKVQGVQVGKVASIVLQMDPANNRLMKPVVIELEPGNLVDPKGVPIQPSMSDKERRIRFKDLVDAGLRARLEIQSLLTGLLYVDLDFYPNRPPVLTGMNFNGLPEVPAIPTTTDEVKNALEEVVRKIKDLPLDSMVRDLAASVGDIRAILASDETRQSREALARSLAQSEKLLAELNRQLPPLVKQVDMAVKDAGQTARDAGQTARDTSTLVRDLRAETKPVLTAAEQALTKATAVLEEAKGAMANVADTTAADSTLQQSLRELRNAARSVRALTDSLERNPSSLIFGRPAQP